MSSLSHCQQCGRRLRDVIFCPLCRRSLCCCACLDEHIAHHPVPVATQLGAENPPPRMRLSPKVWRAGLWEQPGPWRARPFPSRKPGDQ